MSLAVGVCVQDALGPRLNCWNSNAIVGAKTAVNTYKHSGSTKGWKRMIGLALKGVDLVAGTFLLEKNAEKPPICGSTSAIRA